LEKQSSPTYATSSNAEHSYWVKKFWSNFLTYTKNLNHKNSENFKETITAELEKEISNLALSLSHLAPTRSNYLRASAHKYFAKNPNSVVKTYKKILEASQKDPKYLDFNPTLYSYNKDTFRTQFMIELINEIRKVCPDLEQNSDEELEILQKNIPVLDKVFEESLKRNYIELLTKLGDFLKKFNLTEEYTNTFHSILVSNSLNGLTYPCHKDEPDCKCLESIFTKDCLESLSLPNLIGLSGFWINKTSKAIISLNEMVFIINEFNLWDDVKAKKKQLPLDNNRLESILNKTQSLTQLEEGIFDIMESLQLEHPNLTQDEINTIFLHNFNVKVSQKSTSYKKKFDKLFPESANNLNDDLTQMHAMSNTRYLLYRLKDICIFNLIMGSIDSHYSKNWGIIPDSNTKFSNVNFDIEGLNMPLRLHVYKKELIQFLNEYTGEPIMPLYRGAKDMTIDEKYIPTVILSPLFEKQKRFLVYKLNNPDTLTPDISIFLKHIRFLRNDSKMPSSMKTTNSKEPNSINLETNEKLCIKKKKKDR